MKKIYFFFCFLIGQLMLIQIAQAQEASSKLNEKTNKVVLADMAEEIGQSYLKNREKAIAYALANDLPLAMTSDGNYYLIDGISEEGQLIYLKEFNEDAATTTSADRLQPGGSLGLNLTGRDFVAGVWEVGVPNVTHQELVGKISQVDSDSDLRDHATHVTGTIIARGVNPLSRGMAFESSSLSYSAANDESEMATAAANGLIISNHSYGLIRGWEGDTWFGNAAISDQEDYLFGFYNGQTRTFDNIAFNAPYYLIVWAAGNDRNDSGDGTRPPDCDQGTGYDCIGTEAIAKNVMAVGAVNAVTNYTGPQDVVMSSFSGWGPADDGRIKPDVVANGVGVLSSGASSNTSYVVLQGTSMAAPNTTGSLILLQELYGKLHNDELMRAATLKGLAIHTTSEAGIADGPDYSFGWGLLNVQRAAIQLLKENETSYLVEELTLNDQETLEFQVTSDGTSPLIATISWTDPAGSPVPAQLDPEDLMLVNDLDMRVIGPDDTEYFPWILNPANPVLAATTGDNFRDNVEKIEIAAPAAGTYTIRITHKGALANGLQDFSLLASSAALVDDRNTYYWIGEAGGNWTDADNWSLQSGGTTNSTVPSSNDRVIFDVNSFSGDGNTVVIDDNVEAYFVGFFADRLVNFEFGGNSLTVATSFLVDNGNLTASDEGEIIFQGLDDNFNDIDLSTSNFTNTSLTFNSVDGEWNILSDVSVQSLTLSAGILNTNGNALTIASMVFSSADNKTLDLGGSNIDGLIGFDYSGSNLTLVDDGSQVDFDTNVGEAVALTLNGNGLNFEQVSAVAGSLTISGNNSFGDLSLTASATISGNNTIQNLTLLPGANIALEGGTDQTIDGLLDASGNADQQIMISSTGSGNATLNSSNERRFCMDFLIIDGVDIAGTTLFVTGDNSAVINATGWTENNCDDLLFADFDANFLCLAGISEFTDLSTGNPTSWSWEFGSGSTSVDQNPTYQYNQTGQFTVTLTISNGSETNSFSRNVEVVESTTISKPTIIENGDFLISSVDAPTYRWFVDGQLIDNETDNFIAAGAGGTFTVEVQNDQCRFISEAFTITSVEEELTANLLTGVKLYPNPVDQGQLTLEINSQEVGEVSVDIYNTLGVKVQSISGNKTDNSYKQTLPMSTLERGVYLTVIRINGRTTTMRIFN
ncbi:MAG: S8 family serine peptidase [Bacteroidota bacterium]